MSDDFDAIPMRDQMLEWNERCAEYTAFLHKVEEAKVGQSSAQPMPLPPDVAERSAEARCKWALGRLKSARAEAAKAQAWSRRGEKLVRLITEVAGEQRAREKAASRRRFVRAIMLLIVLGGLGAGGYWYWQNSRPPVIPTGLIENAVRQAAATAGLVPASVSSTTAKGEQGTALVQATVTAKLDRTLYAVVETRPYLEQELRWDPKLTARIASVVNGEGGARLVEIAGLSDAAADPTQAILIKEAMPAGSTFDGTVSLVATPQGDTWSLRSNAVAFQGIASGLKPRDAFSGAVFDLGRTEDVARLKAIVAGQASVLPKLEDAKKVYAREVAEQLRQLEADLASRLQPGALFVGTIGGENGRAATPFSLEMTETGGDSGEHAFKARLRNDGGWNDARVVTGAWKYDTSDRCFRMTISSRSDQAVRNAGPMLGEVRTVSGRLAVAEGSWKGDFDGRAAEFKLVEGPDAARVRDEATMRTRAYEAAMAPGSVYTANAAMTGDRTDRLLLEFVSNPDDPESIEAVLEDRDHPSWRRRYKGEFIDNLYREPNKPLVLTRIPNTESPEIDRKGAVFDLNRMELVLDSGALVMRYQGESVAFERVSAEAAATRQAETAAWQEALAKFHQVGGVLEGTVTDPESGNQSRVRLRVLSVDARNGKDQVRLESMTNPALFRVVEGKIDPVTGMLDMEFRTSPRGTDRKAFESFFQNTYNNSLNLVVEGGVYTGKENRAGWRLEFPLVQR